jgi:hypothetical protein
VRQLSLLIICFVVVTCFTGCDTVKSTPSFIDRVCKKHDGLNVVVGQADYITIYCKDGYKRHTTESRI